MGSLLNPVHRMAAQKGLVEIIRRYIEKGGDVNATDSRGCSLLYWAKRSGSQELCRLLVSAGAIEIGGDTPEPALSVTASEGQSFGQDCESELARSPSQAFDVAVLDQLSGPEEAVEGDWVAEEEPADSTVTYAVGEGLPAAGWSEQSLISDEDVSPTDDGWVAEPEAQCLPGDEDFISRVREVQAKINSHVPVDDGAGWDEVEIRKPKAIRKAIHEAVSAAIDEQRVAALIAKIESDSRVSLAQIESIAPRIDGELDDVFMDVAQRIVGELGGIIEDDVPVELFEPAELLFPILKKRQIEEMADVIDFFDERYRGEKSPINVYYSQAKKYGLLSPKEEIKAGREIAECLNEAVRIISGSKLLLRRIVEGLSELAPTQESAEPVEDGSEGDDQQHLSEGMDTPSAALLTEILHVIDEAGEGEIAEERSALIAANLLAFGFGFPDVERLLRKSETDEKSCLVLDRLRASVKRMIAKRNFLVERNLRLVGSVARRYSGSGCDVADLVQEGNIGLMRAAERWDYRLGYKFSTYAMWWIRQSITRFIQDASRTIRIPVHVGEQISACRRQIRKHAGLPDKELMRVVADDLGMDMERLRRILSFDHEVVSLDAIEVADADSLCTDSDITEAYAMESNARRKIDSALSVLDERQREVIRLRFGIGEKEDMTLEQVGRRFGVTRERIRQIESKAILRLSKGQEADLLRALLGAES